MPPSVLQLLVTGSGVAVLGAGVSGAVALWEAGVLGVGGVGVTQCW